jgi:beclin 1
LNKYLTFVSGALDQKITTLQNEYLEINSSNVYNDAFHIWHEGHFGTINNFRLGRLPSQPVDWNEINAALGCAALLLHTIATKKQFTFQKYTIIPAGSFSKIAMGNTQYEL